VRRSRGFGAVAFDYKKTVGTLRTNQKRVTRRKKPSQLQSKALQR
jgi:hypothetical protein